MFSDRRTVGLFALHGAIGRSDQKKVAAYEPLLLSGCPDYVAIRRTLISMQQMFRDNAQGQAILISIRESIGREVGRGHWSSWVGRTVRAIPDLVGAGLFLRSERPRPGPCGLAGSGRRTSHRARRRSPAHRASPFAASPAPGSEPRFSAVLRQA